MRQFGSIDISVAVAIDGGLITPIVKHADQKGFVEISREMKDLAEDKKYTPVIRRLFARLLKLQPEVGDSLDLRSVFAEI